MPPEKEKDSALALGFTIDPATGMPTGASLAVSTDALSRILRFINPKRFHDARLDELYENQIENQVEKAAGGALPESTQALLLLGRTDATRRVLNKQAIAVETFTIDPEIPKLLEAPRPPLEDAAADYDQHFWDQYWSRAESVTAPFMRTHFARIAARQLRDPNSFSVRTLDVIQTLDRGAAEIFTRLKPFVFNEFAVPSRSQFKNEYEGLFNFTVRDFMDLDEAGLLDYQDKTMYPQPGFVFADFQVRPANPGGDTSVQGMYLTRAGREIARIMPAPAFDAVRTNHLCTWLYRRVANMTALDLNGNPLNWTVIDPAG